MTSRIVTIVTSLALCVPVGIALGASPAEAAGLYYSSCDKLHRDYKHGVAKSRKAAMRQVKQGYGRPAFGKRARKVYWRNESRLDRDNDGTACEA